MDNQIIPASIITIGDELLIGQVVDTNSAWISQQLNREGIWVRKKISVGDNYNEIWKVLDQESTDSKIILITGGLGPTADDITKPLLCKYFNSTLVTNQDVLKHVQHLFEDVLKRPFTELNRKQAEVPEVCTVLHNERGTAPGMLFEKNDVLYIAMPGVPHEMQGLITDLVIPLLKRKFQGGFIIHKTLLTSGIGESFLAEHINAWEPMLPSHIKISYLPGAGMIRLRLTGTGSNKEKLDTEMELQFQLLKDLVKMWMVADSDITMPELIHNLMTRINRSLGTVESCTGGYIAHLITGLAGASTYFQGSVVSYSNRVKKEMLHVKETTLHSYGAVSEQTIKEMAQGGLDVLKTDYCIATSGIMGPHGGTSEKPVGTVWIAAASRLTVITRKFHFRYDRKRNIELAAVQALNLLRVLIEQENME